MPVGGVDIVPPRFLAGWAAHRGASSPFRWAARAAEREGTSLRTEGPFAKLASGFAIASTLGLGFATTTGLGIWLGYRCDRALGWKFLGCTIAFGVAGGGAGIVFLVKTLAALDRGNRREPDGTDRREETGGAGRDREDR